MSRTQLAIYSPSGGGRRKKCPKSKKKCKGKNRKCHNMTKEEEGACRGEGQSAF